MRTFLLLFVFFLSISFAISQNSKNNIQNIKKVASGCMPPSSVIDLDINNVRSTIYNNGLLWMNPDDEEPGYEVPLGSGKQSISSGGIIIGGKDNGGNLRLSSKVYSWGDDFFPGPLALYGEQQASTNADVCNAYDRIYKIERKDVKDFVDWYTADQKTKYEDFPEYSVPQSLYDWPALGPEADGFDYFLAPFVDYNGDNLYNPDDGDYPDYDLYNTSQPIATRPSYKATLYGDQTLWWVMNDKGNIQTHTPDGGALGMEIHAQAFAYNSDNQINNMTFYNYQLINRSTYTINDTYFGIIVEGQLGNAYDNFIGFDVSRGLGYLYNRGRDDGNGDMEYGDHPPALGIDFLGGPYKDEDGSDFGETGIAGGCDESIMGVNYNDGIIDNERLGISYFMRVGQSYWNDHTWWPYSANEMYNYLRGYWNDGKPLTYGSTGHEDDPGRDYDDPNIRCRYMFPKNFSDPCFYNTRGVEVDQWTDPSSLNPQLDAQYPERNFLVSTGPFTLEPGAINDVSFGVIWARSYTGFNYSSLADMIRADDVAQTLFENNFETIEGPNAPELEIVELDQQLLIHIWNSSESNNYMEQYRKVDATIRETDELREALDEALQSHDPRSIYEAQKAISDYKSFVFQGYKIYQVENEYVSLDDLSNPELAKLVFQCDIKDDVTTIINYEWNTEYKFYDPVIKVEGNNNGIEHSILINKDLFHKEAHYLVNNLEYYYVAVAYAHNDYLHVDQLDPFNTLYGQKRPYLQSQRSARGPVKIYKAIPHNPSINDGGTRPRSDFGEGLEITQHDGHGNSTNWLELKEETIQQIMDGSPWYADSLQYQKNYGPIQVKIVDPLNVNGGDYILKFEPDSVKVETNHYNRSDNSNVVYYGLILDTKWKLLKSSPGLNLYNDTIHSDGWIRTPNEQLFVNEGFSITITQTDFPGAKDSKFYEIQTKNLGYLGANIEYEDEYVRWLDFLPDEENTSPANWIRSGTRISRSYYMYNDFRGLDNDEIFENILERKWAPYYLTSKYTNGPMFEHSQAYLQDLKTHRLSSVDIIFTNDTSKWTRSAVIDLSENAALAIGGVEKHGLRASPSINKLGEPDGTGSGMGWFPGYAIDVETGVRLNIVYGEASELSNYEGANYNSDDMMWNPTSDIYYDENEEIAVFGGKHYVYIFGHNEGLASNSQPNYDSCSQIYDILSGGNNAVKMQLFMHAMWVSIPIIPEDYVFKNPLDIPNEEIKIKLRIANPYFKDVGILEENAPNNNYPMFSFNTNNLTVEKNVLEIAKKQLELINVVPNPYYGYAEYEASQLDNKIRFTNLPNKCTISIYQTNGTLVRKLEKDNSNPFLDWDLKNQSQITISSGIYLVHINAPGIGEKVLKWFGALRPIDLYGY